MQLEAIRAATKFVTFTYEGVGDLQLEFRPAMLTLYAGELVAAAQADYERQVDAMVRVLTKAVSWWDLYDGENPVPLTEEAVRQVPMSLLTPLMLYLVRECSS